MEYGVHHMIPKDKKQILENRKHLLKMLILPENEIEKKTQQLIASTEKYEYYFLDTVTLAYAAAKFSKRHVDRFVQKMLADIKQFRRLVDDIGSLSFLMHELPSNQARKIEKYVLSNREEFKRLIADQYALFVALSRLPSEYVENIMACILNDHDEFNRIFHDISCLDYAIQCFPSAYAERFLQLILKNSQIFNRLFNTPEVLVYVLSFFPKEYSEQILQCIDSDLKLELRMYVVRFFPNLIPTIINFGIDPYQLKLSRDLLQEIIFYQSDRIDYYIPLILTMGVKLQNQGEYLLFGNDLFGHPIEIETSVIQLLMKSARLSPIKIYTVLAFIQHGEQANGVDQHNKNILQIMYDLYPKTRDMICSWGIRQKKSEDSEFVLGRINISILRLELQNFSPIHQARSLFVNFLILLSIDRMNEHSSSFFKQLPLEILLHVINFCDFTSMQKTKKEGSCLAKYFFSEPDQVKKMLVSPGGVNVFQQMDNNNHFSFQLFKSAKVLYQDYFKLKCVLDKKNQVKNFFGSQSKSKKNSTSQHSANFYQFREKHALEGLKNHLSLYKTPANKLLLLENVNHFRL